MIDIKFFKTYQKQLVWFINTKLGRWFFKVDDEIKNICEVKPNALTYDKHYDRENGKWREVKTTCFRTNNKYARLLNYRLAPLHKLALLLPSLARPELSPFLVPVMLTVDTYYPESGVSIDGHVRCTVSSASFGSMVSGNGSTAYQSEASFYLLRLLSSTTTNGFQQLTRAIICFDTSDIGTDTIDSSTLSIWGDNKTSGLGEGTVHVCQSNPAVDTSLSAGDYQGMAGYTTSFGNVAYADYSVTGYNDIALNSYGLSNISKTGISKFGIKFGWDISNNFDGTWAREAQSNFLARGAAYTGTSSDPKLTVTHSAVITFIPQIMFY